MIHIKNNTKKTHNTKNTQHINDHSEGKLFPEGLQKLHFEVFGHLPVDAQLSVVLYAIVVYLDHVVSELLLVFVAVVVQFHPHRAKVHRPAHVQGVVHVYPSVHRKVKQRQV